MNAAPLGWSGIIRLGLVQTALGAIVVLMTSTINRVMVVELALPAFVPGLLVASHYAIQILRPAWGYGADVGGRRTPWIIGGLATLAIGGVGAALGTALTATNPVAWSRACGALPSFSSASAPGRPEHPSSPCSRRASRRSVAPPPRRPYG